MIDIDDFLLSILKDLDKDSTARKLIDRALEKQDYVYNEGGYIQSIHTNPLFAAFDDPNIFKIGDTIKNIHSGITAKVTSYYDGGYCLSNGGMFPARNKDSWKLVSKTPPGVLSEAAFNACRDNAKHLISYKPSKPK